LYKHYKALSEPSNEQSTNPADRRVVSCMKRPVDLRGNNNA